MYILECADGTYYTGSTKNLDRHLEQHRSGLGANYTAKHKPEKLVYFEEYSRVDEAFYREKQIQNWSHAKKKALIERKFEELKLKAKKDFSKKKNLISK
jgi:putative endonuclease